MQETWLSAAALWSTVCPNLFRCPIFTVGVSKRTCKALRAGQNYVRSVAKTADVRPCAESGRQRKARFGARRRRRSPRLLHVSAAHRSPRVPQQRPNGAPCDRALPEAQLSSSSKHAMQNSLRTLALISKKICFWWSFSKSRFNGPDNPS
jgi:hypothetical protein